MDVTRRTMIGSLTASLALAAAGQASAFPKEVPNPDFDAWAQDLLPRFRITVEPALWSSTPDEVLDVLESLADEMNEFALAGREYPYWAAEYDLDDGGMAITWITPLSAQQPDAGTIHIKWIKPRTAMAMRRTRHRVANMAGNAA